MGKRVEEENMRGRERRRRGRKISRENGRTRRALSEDLG